MIRTSLVQSSFTPSSLFRLALSHRLRLCLRKENSKVFKERIKFISIQF